MNIAMIGHKRIPGREGGVETVVENLSVRMAEMGHSVTVYNRARRGVEKRRAYRGVRIVNVPTVNRKHFDAIICAFLATLHALFCGYDVLHYHAEGPCLMLWLPRLLGRRTVVTIHGLDWQRAKWGAVARRFLLLGEWMAARYANEVIVLTEAARAHFAQRYGRQTRLIHNGVEPPMPSPPAEELKALGLALGEYVLFLARIVPEKGLHTLLEAFAGVRTDKRLVVAGGGGHADAYEQAVRAMADSDARVSFIGHVDGAAKAALYRHASLYVLPSEVEGMALTLLEAMSYGCRCLISDIPENLDAACGLAQTFRVGDAQSLQAALAAALCGDPPPPVNEEALRAALKRHAWPDIAERTLEVYHASRA